MRQSLLDHYMELVQDIGKRSTCNRGMMGAILVKDRRIIATGYAGAPSGLPHCDEEGHQIWNKYDEAGKHTEHCVRTTHAEINAIIQCAKFGVSAEGADLYCTMFPCFDCAKAIINVGIQSVTSLYDYHAADWSKDVLNEAGVKWDVINPGEVLRYTS